MFSTTPAKRRAGPVRPSRRLVLALAAFMALAAFAEAPALAQQRTDNPSGLALPRFASTRSNPINVRVGPGTRYEIAWVYVKAGLPVEIVQEFDTWRKIRDVDGEEGWVHQNLLSGNRIGYVMPWDASAEIPMVSARSPTASARAILGSGLRVSIASCDGTWCAVSVTHEVEGRRPATYSGFVEQETLWGVYGSEVFD